MIQNHSNAHEQFERGAVILSIDTEQIWGYMDSMTESQFLSRFPNGTDAHEKLLSYLCAAKLQATWFLVGGMTLRGCAGPLDERMSGLPAEWRARIRRGSERTEPLWYRRSFIRLLRQASPLQEIGLHGGLTHLIWTDRRYTREVVQYELAEGVKALEEAMTPPTSFSFGRNEEAHYDLLPMYGIRTFRGRPPVLAYRLGRTLPGALLRVFDEMVRATPPPVWPEEVLPGLWNIPSSGFLYPLTPSRTKVALLRNRVERFERGIEAAARHRGIFHFGLHPENLVESPQGFSVLEDILDRLLRARKRGDVEVLTMADAAARMARAKETPAPEVTFEIPQTRECVT